ncbi:MAG: site-specific integrase [Atopobiaceae bacterium]|nr:site-specific integrase [Atopobiaceae bacterium]
MNVYVRKSGRKWRAVAVFSVDGRRVQRSIVTDVPCDEEGNAGKRRAMAFARSWAEGLEPEEANNELHDVSEWCKGRLEARLSAGTIEKSTMRGYSTSLGYISSYFCGKNVEEATAEDVEGFLTWMVGEGLCQNTVKKTFNVLSSCFSQALRSKIIGWDPCCAVKPPKQKVPDPNPLTEQSRGVFLARMGELSLTPEVVGVWIAYFTGIRRGEVCGLRWRGLSLSGDATAIVAGSIGIGAGGTYEKGTKTGKTRVVPVPKQLASILSQRRIVMVESCMAAGVPFSPDLYVLGEIDGGYLRPWRLSKWWKQHRDEWGLMGTQGRPPVFHDLRHTYATVVVRETDVKTAQQIMGHSDVNMTMRYADTPLDNVHEAGRSMSVALGMREIPKNCLDSANSA